MYLQLISSFQLKNMLVQIVDEETNKMNSDFFLQFEESYVVSRNMYATQRIRNDSFGKGYSLSDGRYLLMVTANGLAMYETEIDPTCHNNLLLMYEYDGENLKIDTRLTKRMHYHFTSWMDVDTIKSISIIFEKMKKELHKEVRWFYECGNCISREFEMDFKRIDLGMNRNANDKLLDEKDISSFELFMPYIIGKKVVLYGAGQYGRYCYNKIKERI